MSIDGMITTRRINLEDGTITDHPARNLYRAILATEPTPRLVAERFRAYLTDLRDAARAYQATTEHGDALSATRTAQLAAIAARRFASAYLHQRVFDALAAVALGLREAGEVLAAGELAPEEVDEALADIDATMESIPFNDGSVEAANVTF